ncbi:regulatory protein RecX [Microbacterium soli]|uniref:Regulatory protein RecX n=1 Tax=Microbacterium soli TaxID=446075 RepID=A0ABP7MLP3_9MICO
MEHDDEEPLAPITPIFGGRRAPKDGPRSGSGAGSRADTGGGIPRRTGEDRLWSSALLDGRSRAGVHSAVADGPHDDDAGEGMEEIRLRAQEVLVRRLRGRQLSVSEARSVLRRTDADRETIEQIIDEFQHRGYLDDRTLAQLLVRSGVERRGEGRVALSRTLAQRGIPRELIADALDELPDDDAERALEYARSKAPGMTRLEPETALRRLLGQLARRGYGGTVAMSAARTALEEAGGGGRSGVRFVEAD